MKSKITENELIEIINKNCFYVNTLDSEISLFSKENNLGSIDMVYILLDLEKSYKLNLSYMINQLKKFSIREIMNYINND